MGNQAGCAFAFIILSLIYFIGPLTNKTIHRIRDALAESVTRRKHSYPGLAFTVDFDYRGNIVHLRERHAVYIIHIQALKWLLI